jgi:hypothetical protein
MATRYLLRLEFVGRVRVRGKGILFRGGAVVTFLGLLAEEEGWGEVGWGGERWDVSNLAS